MVTNALSGNTGGGNGNRQNNGSLGNGGNSGNYRSNRGNDGGRRRRREDEEDEGNEDAIQAPREFLHLLEHSGDELWSWQMLHDKQLFGAEWQQGPGQ